eukprot:PITA_32530
MPFGLTNAPATFQATMNELFHPYLRKFVLVFFNDILVYSKTWKEHLKHLEEVLSVLEKNQFYAKLSKCTFGQKEVEYLGHVISREGVQVDPNKIKAIKEWPKPKNLSKLRGFLGLIGFKINIPKGDARHHTCFNEVANWQFSIQTDHSSVQFLLQQKTLSTEQQKWIEKLSAFDLEILHKKGKENVVADALSRKDDDHTTCAAMIVVPEWLDEIRVEYAKDEDCDSMIKNISQCTNFEWKNDILWYKGRIYLTPTSKFKVKILKESHNLLEARHVGFYKTYYNIRQSFY